MPTGFAAHWCRRAIVSIAAWLVVLQAFFAGVAIAQTGATLSFDPVAAAAICHGSGGAGSDDTTAPETGKVRHLCCAYCMSAAPAVPPPAVPNRPAAPANFAAASRIRASPWSSRIRRCARAGRRHLQR